MKWYLVKMVYQIFRGAGEHAPQFDERWRLIRADEMSWAREKGFIIGKLEQQEFTDGEHERVKRVFVNVVELLEVPLLDGAELFATTEEPESASEFLHLMHTKANRLMNFTTPRV